MEDQNNQIQAQKSDQSKEKLKKKCENPECLKVPYYGFENDTTRFCYEHKLDGMIKLGLKICQVEACTNVSSYGFKDDKGLGSHCSLHKLSGMILKRDLCKHDSCTEIALFNSPRSSTALYCEQHKEDGMVEKNKPKGCAQFGCANSWPHFNYPGEPYGSHCRIHQLDGMVRVAGFKPCEKPECKKDSSFNFRGEKGARFCSEHKLVGMINVKNRICEELGCNRRATWRYITDKASRFCKYHKKEGMDSSFRSSRTLKRKIDGMINLTMTPMLLFAMALKQKADVSFTKRIGGKKV